VVSESERIDTLALDHLVLPSCLNQRGNNLIMLLVKRGASVALRDLVLSDRLCTDLIFQPNLAGKSATSRVASKRASGPVTDATKTIGELVELTSCTVCGAQGAHLFCAAS
jgi:hypothetical protein